MRDKRRIGTASVLFCLSFGVASPAFGQAIVTDVRHDISPPLSALPPPHLAAQVAIAKEHRVKPIPLPPVKAAALADTALQRTATKKLPMTPVRVIEGLGQGTSPVTSDPPDTTGAVGTTQYVQWVNTSLAVFNKTSGQRVLGPIAGNAVWQGFGGNCEQFNDGDPIVQYDRAANRWVLTQFAVNGQPFSQCLAVSTGPDATGTYARYEFQFQDFNDYPKFGVWPDAYYGTFNMFHSDNTFLGAKACAFERAKMLAGEQARMQCFDVSGVGGLLPADLDGTTPPPGGSPNYLLAFGADELQLWKFRVDWNNPSSSAFTGPGRIKTAPFEIACRTAPRGACIVQPRTTQRLDAMSDRLMYRLAYRNFGTHESLVVNHTVAMGPRSGVRWYEVREPGGTPKIQQQGTYAPAPQLFRWVGSMAMDKTGNVAMGYSVSGSNTSPAIRFTGRSAGDPPNQMGIEQRIKDSQGSQASPDRWGDYSTMSVDPTDDCTFWFTTQYLPNTGSFNWRTAIASFKFSNCQ